MLVIPFSSKNLFFKRMCVSLIGLIFTGQFGNTLDSNKFMYAVTEGR